MYLRLFHPVVDDREEKVKENSKVGERERGVPAVKSQLKGSLNWNRDPCYS